MAKPAQVEFPGQKKTRVRMRGTKHANEATGDYSLDGTDMELKEIREIMGDSFRMQGFYSSDVAVETNHPIPGANDPGETITITWVALTFTPEEVKMAS